MHCWPFIWISVQHHVWRVSAAHKLVLGCDDFLFYFWIATMPSWYILFLGCGMAGEKNDKILMISSCGKQVREGDYICNTFFVHLQICSWSAGVKFAIPPSSFSDVGA
jgi:hypothetical protein